MNRHSARLQRALAFLSRFPAREGAFADPPQKLSEDVAAFPLAGCIIALIPALMLLACTALGLSPLTAAIVAIASLAAISGALHEDGLADVADGLFGNASRERALTIMKDSRIGAYGALALILAVALRVALLAEIIAARPVFGTWALLAASGVSRGGMVFLWASLPPANPGGVAGQQGQPSAEQTRFTGIWTAGILLVAGFCAAGIGGVVLAALLALVTYLWCRALFARRLGGQTGDTLGACQQGLEIAVLLGLAIAL